MAELNDDIFFATIGELNAKLMAKEISAVELTRAFCDRLEKVGPRYNALAHSMRDSAIKKAKDVDGDLKRDRKRGPLQGIPFGVKDLLAVKGHPTTWGAKPFAGQTFKESAAVVDKLDSVGAILIGKLAMVELAGGGGYRYPSASLTGPGLNPWNREHWSGGSSSGSGAATAAGLVTFALGSETSGSILTPSAFCGVTGLRPTYGLVSRRGAMALSWTLDKIGPLCRSVEDCAMVLHAIAGSDLGDPGSAGKSFYYATKYARKPAEFTVGYAPVDFDEYADESARPALKAGLEGMKSLGVKLKEIEIPDFPYGALTGIIVAAEGAAIFEDILRDGRADELADKRQVAGLRAGLDITAVDYLRAMRARTLVQDAFHKLFMDVDLLLAPARLGPANKATDRLDGFGAPQRPTPKSRGLNGLIPAGNLAGLPAVSMPCGFANGLPVALSLVARPFYENRLIDVGRAFQSATDWHRKRPPVSS
jgi:aspartyl-tRNA(Asn)/glutamyl-tRNA(Gln) amidotransferase subunit A